LTATAASAAPEAGLFLEALFAGKPEDLRLLLWTLPEKRSHWFQDIERAVEFAESRQERDLYVGVGLSGQDYGPTRRCAIGRRGRHRRAVGGPRPAVRRALRSTALPADHRGRAQDSCPVQLPPDVHHPDGERRSHAWWLFREPLIFESDEERARQPEISRSGGSRFFRLNAAVARLGV
jgi:hypothetical protein